MSFQISDNISNNESALCHFRHARGASPGLQLDGTLLIRSLVRLTSKLSEFKSEQTSCKVIIIS